VCLVQCSKQRAPATDGHAQVFSLGCAPLVRTLLAWTRSYRVLNGAWRAGNHDDFNVPQRCPPRVYPPRTDPAVRRSGCCASALAAACLPPGLCCIP